MVILCVKKKKFSFKKLILLILEVQFYYWLTAIFLINRGGLLTFKDLFVEDLLFFPVISNRFWFITCYILLFIISPYLNILIDNLDREKFRKFIFVILIIWCVFPTIFGIFKNSSENLLYFSRFLWFIVLYFVGSYIRIYKPKILSNVKGLIYSILCLSVFLCLFILLVNKYSNFFEKIGLYEPAYFWHPNSVLLFLLSVSIFSLFLKFKIKYSRIITSLASTTLGLYLLHDGLLEVYIWRDFFKTYQYIYTSKFFVHILFTTLVIFVVGVVIDLIRQFFEKHIVKRILDSKFCESLGKKVILVTDNILSHF